MAGKTDSPNAPATDDDRQTLLEIARLIETGDEKAGVAVTNGQTGGNEAARDSMAGDSVQKQDDAPGGVQERGFAGELLESLPVAAALYSCDGIFVPNTTFALALGYGSTADLISAGGMTAVFPEHDEILFAAASGTHADETAELHAITRSGRKRSFPAAIHGFGPADAGEAGLCLLELYPDQSTAAAVEEAIDALAGAPAAPPDGSGAEALPETGAAPDAGTEETARTDAAENGTGAGLASVKIVHAPKPRGRKRIRPEAATPPADSRTDVLAKISHEVRTPLNSIIGFAELMKEEQLGALGNSRYKGYIRDIYDSGQHALNLINDLLEISKSQTGNLGLNFTLVDLAEAVREAVEQKQELAQNGRVFLRMSLCEDIPGVLADRRTIEQILHNLLSNAIRFSPSGHQVIVSLRRKPSGAVRLRVHDEGAGMSKEDIRRTMDPFRQADTTPGKQFGTGLGLPLTRALAKANQAKFKLKSRPGEGTRVDVIFPAGRLAPN